MFIWSKQQHKLKTKIKLMLPMENKLSFEEAETLYNEDCVKKGSPP